jgi:hypothetical protein
LKRIIIVALTVIGLLFASGASQADVFDNFNSLDSGVWEESGGTWSVSNGVLTGYWSESAAQTDQGSLFLKIFDPSSDYEMEFESPNNVGKFVLWVSAGNMYQIAIYDTRYSISVRENGQTWYSLSSDEYSNLGITTDDCSNGKCTSKVKKIGNDYSLYFNDNLIYQFSDSIWNGINKIGLATYGTREYNYFYLKSDNTCPPSTSIILNSDLSFSFDATYSPLFGEDMDLTVNFKYFGEQNDKLLWELDSYTVE